MDYNTLLDVTTELGYCLAMNGAETFRVEESINRVMDAYGIKAEVFCIPNCLHVSIETAEGAPMTRMRRIGYHGNDLDGVEKYNALSRRICQEQPEPGTAKQWLVDTQASLKTYPLLVHMIGNFLTACGFTVLFGGSLIDCLCAGLCGLLVSVINLFTDRFKANQFFRTVAAAFPMAMLAYFTSACGISDNPDAIIIGALMILVPGLLFTNALRDIIYGDTNSGINRIVQVLLIAVAIALGTGAALNIFKQLWNSDLSATPTEYSLALEAIATMVLGIGFTILLNIHGKGAILCAIGGVITWVAYRLICRQTGNDITGYFIATMIAALYSEIMARIRKYPAISYLVISIIPLIPGAGVYYAVNHFVRGDMTSFANQGTHTLAIAGAMAVGILLISTIFRFISMKHRRKP